MRKERQNERDDQVKEKDQPHQAPPLYQMVLHNDDYTPMEFVVAVLERFFHMSRMKANEAMLSAHVSGKTRCGIFTKDVAASKIAEVDEYSKKNDHPLRCSIEVAQ